MATVTGYSLRLPASLMAEVKQEAEAEGTSINQFINVALARRLAEVKTIRHFERRAARAYPEAFRRIVAKAGTLPPPAGRRYPRRLDGRCRTAGGCRLPAKASMDERWREPL